MVFCRITWEHPFLGPTFWEVVLRIGIYGAGASVVAAMVVLTLTINDMHFSSATASAGVPLVYDTPPQPAAFLAVGILGTGVFVCLLVFFGFWASRGLKVLFRRRNPDHVKRKSLKDYV
jgi:uncharacterized membrane protein